MEGGGGEGRGRGREGKSELIASEPHSGRRIRLQLFHFSKDVLLLPDQNTLPSARNEDVLPVSGQIHYNLLDDDSLSLAIKAHKASNSGEVTVRRQVSIAVSSLTAFHCNTYHLDGNDCRRYSFK